MKVHLGLFFLCNLDEFEKSSQAKNNVDYSEGYIQIYPEGAQKKNG